MFGLRYILFLDLVRERMVWPCCSDTATSTSFKQHIIWSPTLQDDIDEHK